MIALHPYLHFKGNARDAITFYQSVFGGELTITTFNDANIPNGNAGDNILHSQLTAPTLTLLASDQPEHMTSEPVETNKSVAMWLSGDDDATLRTYFARLTDGGSVVIPLPETTEGPTFGILADTFGTEWMINIA